MDRTDRISAIEKSIEALRKTYNTIKTDLAVVERRRKKIKRKEREMAEKSSSGGTGGGGSGGGSGGSALEASA
jgi:uncharacterized membrane protein YgcG